MGIGSPTFKTHHDGGGGDDHDEGNHDNGFTLPYPPAPATVNR